MDEDAASDDKVDPSDQDVEEDNVSLQEVLSPDAERFRALGAAGEVLARVELDLAYSSEKLLNLDILLMHVVTRENDYENSVTETEEVCDDSIKKGWEFDLLSGILDSEVRELEKFMGSLQPEILDVREKISSCESLRDAFSEMERKLRDSEESLEQSLNQVAEIRMQCDKFQRIFLAFFRHDNGNNGRDVSENYQFSDKYAKIKMQTVEQQRHILRMLEKSLARELDLEKKLSDSRNCEEELNLKLHSAEQEMFCMDEAVEDILWRLFEAENASEVFMGISKEIMGRLQIIQFNLNGYIKREGEMRSKLQNLMKPTEMGGTDLGRFEISSPKSDDSVVTVETLKANLMDAEDRYTHASTEVLTLRERVQSLELQLKECELQLPNAKVSVEENQKDHSALMPEMSEMKNIIKDLKENMSKAESRAEAAENKCSLLEETNLMLNEELGLLKSSENGVEKVSLLEKRLRESATQLQNAKASAEASQEQQNMLYSAIKDMENLINDLKSKVSKAESRAKKSEAQCDSLTETNSELNEEVSFLRSKMESLENCLHRTEEEKIATSKEINKRAKVITDMLMQLALERERLHKQMSVLTKENKILVAKYWKVCHGNNDEKGNSGEVDLATGAGTKESEAADMESSSTSFKVNNSERDVPESETEVEHPVSAVDAVVGESNSESAWWRGAWQLESKYFLVSIVILLVSAIAVRLFIQKGTDHDGLY